MKLKPMIVLHMRIKMDNDHDEYVKYTVALSQDRKTFVLQMDSDREMTRRDVELAIRAFVDDADLNDVTVFEEDEKDFYVEHVTKQ